MITLHTWSTPNGRKISIMLEECGLPYAVVPIDITAGAQFAPDFVAISPAGKIPALVDDEGPGGAPIRLFESGAILVYLAARSGRRLPACEYLAGEYSIADIATFPWVARHEWQRVDLAAYPAVRRWFEAIAARPAVARGMKVPA